MARFRFQELEVWQKAIDFADLIYELTGRFPDDERFGLRNQLRRAAVSVSSNIAEGNGRTSQLEYIRFVEIAYASLMEVISQLHIAERRKYISNHQLEQAMEAGEQIAKMLSGLRNHLKQQK